MKLVILIFLYLFGTFSELMCPRKKTTFNEKIENNLCFDGERYYVKLLFTKLFGQIPCNSVLPLLA